MRKFPMLGSALVLALSGAFIAAPAMAFTHHPSTPQERAQTKELNMQSLQQAQGQAPANQQAMNGQAAPQTQEQPAAPQAQPQATPGQGDPNQTAPVTAPSGTTPSANSDDSTAGQQPAPQQQ